jgi:hypothetical protein
MVPRMCNIIDVEIDHKQAQVYQNKNCFTNMYKQ